jgi:hypothetical protein
LHEINTYGEKYDDACKTFASRMKAVDEFVPNVICGISLFLSDKLFVK